MKSTQKTWNVHGQCQYFALGPNATYIPHESHRGLASGKMQILVLGNAKIYQHVGISNAKFWRQGIAQRQPPTPGILRRSGIEALQTGHIIHILWLFKEDIMRILCPVCKGYYDTPSTCEWCASNHIHKVYKSPFYRGVRLWERLPNVSRTIQTKKEFKHSIRCIESVEIQM